MKRYFELSTRERIEDSDKVAIQEIERELRKKLKKEIVAFNPVKKPDAWKGWKWPKKSVQSWLR